MNLAELPLMPLIALVLVIVAGVSWVMGLGNLLRRAMLTVLASGAVWAMFGTTLNIRTDGFASKVMAAWVLFLFLVPVLFKKRVTEEDEEIERLERPSLMMPKCRKKNLPAGAIVDLERKVSNENYDGAVAVEQRMDEYVYVVDNPAFASGLVKIGMTTQSDYNNRIRSLQRTGIPLPFRKRVIIATHDARSLESALHEQFSHKRLANNREFFTVAPQEILDVLPRLGDARVIEAHL